MANGDDLETVQHPTLGELKFPRSMSQQQRQDSIDYAIRQKYGLPQDADLHAKDQEAEATRVGRDKYRNAYYEANTGLDKRAGGTFGEEVARGMGLDPEKIKRMQTDPEGKVHPWRGALEVGREAMKGMGDWMTQVAHDPYRAADPLHALASGFTRGAGLPDIRGQGFTQPSAGQLVGSAAMLLSPEAETNLRRFPSAVRVGVEGFRRGAGLSETLPRVESTPRTHADLRPLEAPPARETLPPVRQDPLDTISQQLYGKNYNDPDMTSAQQIEVTRQIGRGEGRRVMPGVSPTGVERRAAEMPMPERRLEDLGAPGGIERRARREVQEMPGYFPSNPAFEDWNIANRRRINEAIEQERGTLTPTQGAPAPPAPPVTQPEAPGTLPKTKPEEPPPKK